MNLNTQSKRSMDVCSKCDKYFKGKSNGWMIHGCKYDMSDYLQYQYIARELPEECGYELEHEISKGEK
jgi:hypothetical protein